MRYQVKAIRGLSEVALLPVDAANEEEASAYARRQGYDVVSVDRDRTFGLRIGRNGISFPVVQFSQELIALLRAGLNLVEAIEILHRKEKRQSVRATLADLLTALRQGSSFSSALQSYPTIFSPLYVATVRANERTGGIQDALARYVEYQLQLQKVRSKVVSASIYPALLLAVGGLVVLFLLGYVVPRFSRVYHDIGDRLPLFSRWLMEFGQAMDENAWLAFTLLLGLAVILYCIASATTAQRLLVRTLWRLPGIGPQRRIYELAQFYRSLGMLLRSGLPVVPALGMSRGLLSEVLQQALDKAGERIRAGATFSVAMSELGLTTELAYSMIVVGERSGNLSGMLDVVAAFHEEELGHWVDRFTRLFEPVLMAVIGVVIGLIVVFMYMPVFELSDAIR